MKTPVKTTALGLPNNLHEKPVQNATALLLHSPVRCLHQHRRVEHGGVRFGQRFLFHASSDLSTLQMASAPIRCCLPSFTREEDAINNAELFVSAGSYASLFLNKQSNPSYTPATARPILCFTRSALDVRTVYPRPPCSAAKGLRVPVQSALTKQSKPKNHA